MKLPERLARRKGRGFHSGIATTFAVEFAAFEEVMLPQLSAGGATNVVLVADQRMAAMALSDGSALPEALGREYILFSPPVEAGVFHPKIIVQVGRDGGRCIVSSANVTGAGLGGNVEVAVEVECGVEPSAERAIVQSAWRYVSALVPADSGAPREAIDWARDRARWLEEPSIDAALSVLEDGTAMAFVAAPGDGGIGARFADLVGGEAVERLIVVSPYWDEDLTALGSLEQALHPARTSLLLDVKRHEFPASASMPGHREIIDISQWRPSRFTHAKLLIAITAGHEHVLSGSANCTVAALGAGAISGVNREACIYRRVPRGAATTALELDKWLGAQPVEIADLPPRAESAPIPLDEMERAAAGSFEADGGRLYWMKPADRWTHGIVVLTDALGQAIVEVEVTRFAGAERRQSAWIGEDMLSKAAFVFVRMGSQESVRTFITHRSALRSRRRETASGSAAKALSIFDDGSDLFLFAYQAFEELCRAEIEDEEAAGRAHPNRPAVSVEGETSEIRFLTYEEFMAARSTRRGKGGRSDSTLAGTHFNSVRALLNRLSGAVHTADDGSEDDGADDWMDLGDETGDLDEIPDRQCAAENVEVPERPAPDMAAYDKAVKTYVESLTNGDHTIGPRDVLRLRLWIVLILREARSAAAPKGMPATIDDKGWPRLIIRIVSAFFWGKKSALTRLIVSTEYEEMPVDFMECWSTVIWALDRIVASVHDQPRSRDFLKRVPILRAHIIGVLGLTASDLEGEQMGTHRTGLDKEIGERFRSAIC
ncbi:hypothetical protein [Sphingobium sp. Cam5-1]|uniref:hypothetical protein n=1 Tax=Sphingobium sp. Cam5-1 TaxID=2789327 RepID=UPI0018AD13B0|nr:hypothetical protein [Sphingobium sp. Cam5-1]QPI75568.1 hypothetical protein IZV00_19145 [Sphingobium sp. Cam5-1]